MRASAANVDLADFALASLLAAIAILLILRPPRRGR